MTKKKLKRISNMIFIASTLFALFTLGLIARDYIALMGTNVCPISRHNGLVYTSLGLLLGSILITSFLDAKAKKMEDASAADIYDKTLENRKQEEVENSSDEIGNKESK